MITQDRVQTGTVPDRPEGRDEEGTRPKTFVLGIDGATFRIVDYLIARGELPHLSALLRDGVRAPLTSTTPPITPAAWTSFATGTNPGRHGVVDFMERSPVSYQGRPIRSTSIPEPRMWDLLSSQGRRVIVYNVPITYPPHRVNGVIVSGMDTPSLRNRFVYPASVQAELLRAVPDYVIDAAVNPSWGTTKEDLLRQLDVLLDTHIRGLEHLLDTQEWDYCAAVFIATDRYQHAFWSHIEAALQSDSAQPVDRYGEALFSAYRRLDAYLGRLRERCGPQATFVIASDHGFGPLDTYVNLRQILADGGFLALEEDAASTVLRRVWRLRKSPWLRGVKGAIRRFAPGLARGAAHRMSLTGERIDWTRTLAYSFDYFGSIYLNLCGREPAGIVEPGAYDETRERIIAYLRSVVDPRDGQPVFTQIWRKEEVYSGHRTERLPDIALCMRGYSYMARRDMEMGGRTFLSLVERARDPQLVAVSGEHRPDGVLILQGPAFERGVQLANARITDVAPTLLYVMGCPLPPTLDGRILEDAFLPSYRAMHPVYVAEQVAGVASATASAAATIATEDEEVYSEEDEELVTERLRGLGYVE